MFAKIAKFFIENSKLTSVLVFVIMLVGIFSYFILAKQYNPKIVVPAFSIMIEANGLSNQETSKLIVSPLENKIMEIEGIDEVYGIAGDNYAGAMVKFKVGVDKESAKIRLNQKLNENLDLAPLGIKSPIIKSIDPDELSQITYAITLNDDSLLSSEEKYIYLRSIANLLKDEIKTVKNITTIDIIGGFTENIIVNLDIDKLESNKIDIMQVYQILESNNLNFANGNLNLSNLNRVFIETKGKINSIDDIKKILITKIGDSPIYLEDISEIKLGVKRIDNYGLYNGKEAVFIGFGKAIGTNAVFVTDDIIEKINIFKETLPKNIELKIIQNEGETARHATNMLLINLAQSVVIVFFVLALYLGRKDAFNTALSIPLTLGLVFFLALIIGDNINKITLFALILVLGMLVDNSTVVVENISRHLNERIKTGETKLNSVLNGVQEVGVGVILSTLSRLLAFGAMFAVGGMMGEYMGPIPKFAIFALVISLIIAFSINPWVSFYTAKDLEEKTNSEGKKSEFEKKIPDIRKIYLNFMKKFLKDDKKSFKNRKTFKLIFWITLFGVIIAPVYLGIFKARMLPKSNQNQIYLWIDGPREWTSSKMLEVENSVNDFFFDNKNNIPKDLKIAKETSSTIGTYFMPDFANLFRGGLNRIGENQISMRVNLYSPSEYQKLTGKSRINSEKYTIEIRDYLNSYLLEKYPDLKIRLLEDPPGPPVRATFLAKIKSNANEENTSIFKQKVEKEILKINKEYSIVDVLNSDSTTYKKINLNIDHEAISRAGLSVKQVANTLAIALNGLKINLVSNDYSLEENNLILAVLDNQIDNLAFLKNMEFTNNIGEKIPLTSVVNIDYSFVGKEINTDKREETSYIYGEMGDNSLVYPMFKLIGIFKSKEFLGGEYELVSWNPYSLTYKGISDGKKYKLEWGGEWELTLDTFRDLGLAMGVSLLAIYFLLVGQFASFGIAGIIMITFLLSFFGIFPGFTFLYLLNNEYFSATSMIGIIALGGIVVGNAIILIDYLNVLKRNGLTIEDALLKAGYVRFAPIILTSLTTVFGAMTIIGDPVWSGLAWSIIWGLLLSSILTLIVIPLFYYDSQKKSWNECMKKDKIDC